MQKVYTKIESIVGNVVSVRAEGIRNGDLALVGNSYANVLTLDHDQMCIRDSIVGCSVVVLQRSAAALFVLHDGHQVKLCIRDSASVGADRNGAGHSYGSGSRG